MKINCFFFVVVCVWIYKKNIMKKLLFWERERVSKDNGSKINKNILFKKEKKWNEEIKKKRVRQWKNELRRHIGYYDDE